MHEEVKYLPSTLITLKPHYSLQGETASQILLRNTHLHTFNSDCRTINDYQTFNTTYDIYIYIYIYTLVTYR